ncbi:MAG: CNNM domain-containing protein [Pseudomonadota bacterium]|nr:CNNM domain-containing protein [Pseudomonadota bacterium]
MNIRTRSRLPIAVTLGCLLLATTAAVAATAGSANPIEASATQTDVILLIIFVLSALVISFLCSLAEATLLSITPSYIADLNDKNPKKAAALKQLKDDNIDRSLAAILTLNTVAHTVGAIGSGAKATVVFGSAWFGVFSAVMTLLILFLSEILPKTLGAMYWRKLSGFTAWFVRVITLGLYPLIWISEKFTKLLARGHDVHVFSRDEFVAMAGIGQESGHINERESQIIRNLFRFSGLRAQDIMTPRTVITALDETLTVSQALAEQADTPFSRIPLYSDDIHTITGFVLKNEILLSKSRDQADLPLTHFKREIMTVTRSISLSSLLELLLNHRQHIALVVGEYGETKGIVTLEDVIETLLGMEIMDEVDKVEDMQLLARQQWEKRALALGINIDLLYPKEEAESDKSLPESNPEKNIS